MEKFNIKTAKDYASKITLTKSTVEETYFSDEVHTYGGNRAWFYKAIEYKEFEFAINIALGCKQDIDKSMIHDLLKSMIGE